MTSFKRGDLVTVSRPNAKRKGGTIVQVVRKGEHPNLDRYPLRAYHKARPQMVREIGGWYQDSVYVLPKPRNHTSYVVKIDGKYTYPLVKYLRAKGGR